MSEPGSVLTPTRLLPAPHESALRIRGHRGDQKHPPESRAVTQRTSPSDVTVNRAVPIRPGDGATSATAATSKLFAAAFAQSKNVMALVDARRQIVDANAACVKLVGYERSAMIGQPVYQFVAGGPVLSPAAWRAALKEGQFTGTAELACADGSRVPAQWAATIETVTDRQLVLFVALSTSRWGARFRRTEPSGDHRELSGREREIVHLVALGNTGPEIADQLQIAHDTVRTHVRNAMVKMDARSRAHLVAKTLGNGLAWGEG
jgi:PAS domain S-box-containing protein